MCISRRDVEGGENGLELLSIASSCVAFYKFPDYLRKIGTGIFSRTQRCRGRASRTNAGLDNTSAKRAVCNANVSLQPIKIVKGRSIGSCTRMKTSIPIIWPTTSCFPPLDGEMIGSCSLCAGPDTPFCEGFDMLKLKC